MNVKDQDGFVTLDETVCDSVEVVSDSLNTSSKRKADESNSDCTVEYVQPNKRLCKTSPEDQDECVSIQVITVQFGSQDMARKYSKQITDFVSQLVKSDVTTSKERDGLPCLEFYGSRDSISEDNGDVQVCNNEESATVDTLPQYDQTFTGAIGSSAENKDDAGDSKPKNICFNCEGNHMMVSCPEPRDGARIAKNRREHMSKNPTYSRYHEEADQRFSHLKPGVISDGLREALGLRACDMPLHTYRMRVLGYPPGWLRAARLQRSNIAVHHEPRRGHDKASQEADENEEVLYDTSKLIAYPGFNHRQSRNFRDEHHRLGFPPMQSHQSLRTMKAQLPTRRQRAAAAGRPSQTDAPLRQLDDMDVVDDERSPAAKDSRVADGGNTAESSREGSPSLETLEEQRRRLLDSLQADPTEEEEEEPLVQPPPPAAHSTPLAAALAPGASRRRDLGTPVAATATSGRPLPTADKWAAGITEHIPYENLPGATGAWDRMSGLMKRLREQLTGKR